MTDNQETSPGLARFSERLRAARHVVVLTGAGISAESGLATFRDPLTGLWARYRPEDLASAEAFERNPALVWAWYGMRRGAALAAAPNPGHLALARLESLVPRLTLVTQNVDGLHARAGSRDPVELHGSLFRARCVRGCGVREEAVDEALAAERVPQCPGCGAMLRPGVVWFGEPLPEEALRRAWAAAAECEVFLAVGTSGQVYPAAALPGIAGAAGAAVATVNERAGEVLSALLRSAWPG